MALDLGDPEVRNYVAWCAERGHGARWRTRAKLVAHVLRARVGGRARVRALLRRARSIREPKLLDAGAYRLDPATIPTTWTPARYFFAPSDVPVLVEAARRWCKDEVESVVSAADRMSRGALPLLGGLEVAIRENVDWQCGFADQEQRFFLHRFSYAPVLAKAALYTGDARYVETLVRLLKDWGHATTVGERGTWESYSVAERVVNWTQTAYLLAGHPQFHAFVEAWLRPEIGRHAAYLADHLETALMHNHLVNDARALLVYGTCFPDLPRAAVLRELGWEILAREMLRQTLPDGIFREQSTHYHLLLARTFTEAIGLARRQERPVTPQLLAALERMHGASAAMLRGDGTIALVGDICPDIESRPLAGFLAVGAVLFDRPEWKRPEAFTEHALWYLGADGVAAWERLETRPAGVVAAQFPDGGFAFLANPDPMPTHVTVHCDPRGQRLFHGDDDPLGVVVWAGRDVVVDAGNASYNADDCDYFRGLHGQSTLTLDGLPPWVEPRHRGWFGAEYERWTSRVEAALRAGRPCAEASHTGYHRRPTPVTLRRSVTVEGARVVIIDTLGGAGSVDVDVRFHLGPGHAVLADGAVGLSDSEGAIAELRASGPTGVSLALEESWIAPRYGVKRRGQVARVRYRGPVPAEIVTTIRVRATPERGGGAEAWRRT